MSKIDLLHRETTHEVIGAFYEVYQALGFGFLEHVYSLALENELHALPPIAKRQTLNYLRASNLEVALVLHFGPAAKFHRLILSRLHRSA